MIGHRCKNCLWWDHQHERLKNENIPSTYGFCRKHKPAIVGSKGWHWGAWPLVDENDFCGEFRLDEGV